MYRAGISRHRQTVDLRRRPMAEVLERAQSRRVGGYWVDSLQGRGHPHSRKRTFQVVAPQSARADPCSCSVRDVEGPTAEGSGQRDQLRHPVSVDDRMPDNPGPRGSGENSKTVAPVAGQSPLERFLGSRRKGRVRGRVLRADEGTELRGQRAAVGTAELVDRDGEDVLHLKRVGCGIRHADAHDRVVATVAQPAELDVILAGN